MILPSELVDKITSGAWRQFEALAHLAEGRKTIFDIGCGLAMLPAFIAQNFPIETVHLMDGAGGLEPRGGYHADTNAWADVRLGAAVMRENTDVPVFLHIAPNVMFSFKADLIISSRSWGHHYPVSVYTDLVRETLTPAGVVIMDIRNNTNGVETMRDAGFEVFERIPDPSTKCQRLAFRWRA